MSVDEVFAAIAANLPFIRGITVSGGECSLYLPFITALFTKCRGIGLTCLIDSNGTIPLRDEPVMAVCDGVMLDVKAWDNNTFFHLTGGHNDNVIKNLGELSAINKLDEIRVVCFEEEDPVDAERVISGLAGQIEAHKREHTQLKLIRFRCAGVSGDFKHMPSPSLQRMDRLKQLAIEYGFNKVKII